MRVAREALYLAILVSAPALVAAVVVGLVVGVVQTVTQLQESTLSFVPKMAAVLLVLAVLGPWMAGEIVRFTTVLWSSLPTG
ncbi:MAG: type III secretion system export apparatus subunit SctS [Deltaproteobacteria bacterium]|nr:type III secretion system export apparatus subunit SctS [Deltaproteobacteria bacterium]